MTAAKDPATTAARAGLGQPDGADAVDLVPPLPLSTAQAFRDLGSLDSGIEGRDSYRRYGGGSAEVLERAIADLETVAGAVRPQARVTSSGQAALLLATTMLVSPSRKRVVVLRPCYGATESLLAGPLGNLGVRVTTVDLPVGGEGDHASLIALALGNDVAAVITEVITNPLLDVVDVPAIAAVCHEHDVPYVVDGTFATPFLFQPFAHGADLVFHSLTKHLGGHSDVLGGVVLIRDGHPAADWLDVHARLVGSGLAPFDSWLALRGLRTGSLRLERSSSNAAALAEWFCSRPEIAAVHYPGIRGGDDAERARRLLPLGRGPVLSIDVRGGQAAVDAVVRHLGGIRLVPSLGDVATTVSHPALTSHRALSRDQRAALGIGDGLLRISTGVEAIDDLRAEFDAALAAVR